MTEEVCEDNYQTLLDSYGNPVTPGPNNNGYIVGGGWVGNIQVIGNSNILTLGVPGNSPNTQFGAGSATGLGSRRGRNNIDSYGAPISPPCGAPGGGDCNNVKSYEAPFSPPCGSPGGGDCNNVKSYEAPISHNVKSYEAPFSPPCGSPGGRDCEAPIVKPCCSGAAGQVVGRDCHQCGGSSAPAESIEPPQKQCRPVKRRQCRIVKKDACVTVSKPVERLVTKDECRDEPSTQCRQVRDGFIYHSFYFWWNFP